MTTTTLPRPTLAAAVAKTAYPDFAHWWGMGEHFLTFMAEAIGSQWLQLMKDVGPAVDAQIVDVQTIIAEYITLVYHRDARENLAQDFFAQHELSSITSGEFDAISYGYYKSTFDTLAATNRDVDWVHRERHAFTQRVGQRFYHQLHDYLDLQLPPDLQTEAEFAQLKRAINAVGNFLREQGYLRDHFAFHFEVQQWHGEKEIIQHDTDVVARFQQNQVVYALYEMGYPVILPSAVYLYQTMGEAQHHSSRTIEELFGRIGYKASETPDFDPTGYSSDMVVELWEISR